MKSAVDRKTQGVSRQLIETLSHRRLFIGLDRDGTLVPIHARPSEAVVPQDVQLVVRDIASLPGVYLCVVSARSISQLRSDFGSEGLTLAGNYGLEIDLANGEKIVHPEAAQARVLLVSAKEELLSRLRDAPVIVDDHGLSLCVHWHLVPDDAQQLVHGAVAAVKDKISDLHFRLLPTSYEVVLLDSWNKADALDVIAAHIPDIDDRLAIFIGDSEGDESAFVWVNKLEGVSIRVGSAVESNARLTLSSPQQVIEFLKELLASRSSGL